MNDYYENVPLKEYEQILANREYWDCFSCEWERYSTIEQKLVRMGTFVQRGGDLNRVIALYEEGREYTYRVMIQHCIERYLKAITDKRVPNLTLRLYKLEKEEAVALLSELLKAGVKRMYDFDKYTTKEWHIFGSVDSRNLDSEGILSAIEEEHRQAHPDETKDEIKARVMNWIWESLW